MTVDRPIVFVVDDDASMREAVQDLIASVGMEARGFATPQEFLESSRPDAPSCLVLDVRLPGASGLAFQQELARSGAPVPVIFITGHGDIPMSVRAIKAGAAEFFTKPFKDQELLDAINAAIERSRTQRREAAVLEDLRQRYVTLTPREREIMALVILGRLNKQVAGELGVSEVTVKVHRGQIMRKMRAKSLPELVRMGDALRPGAAKDF
ncbi:MAG: response regulator transcription factor [Pseudomonadota bacterium]